MTENERCYNTLVPLWYCRLVDPLHPEAQPPFKPLLTYGQPLRHRLAPALP